VVSVKSACTLQGAGSVLIQTKEVEVQAADITRIFGADGNVSSATKGSIIDLYTNSWPADEFCHLFSDRNWTYFFDFSATESVLL